MAVELDSREADSLSARRLVRVSRMRMGDIDTVMQIEESSFPVPWSRNLYMKEVTSLSGDSVAAVGRFADSKEVIAHAVWWLIADECHLANIAVAPMWRRQGVGDAMLRACIHDAIRRDLKYIVLEVRRSNINAQRLYTKYGFRIIAIRRGYYQDNDEDALVMMLSPVPSASLEGLEVCL